MEAFHKLPAKLQKSLQRWYFISGIALSITLFGMATAHLFTSLQLKKIASTIPQSAVTALVPPQELEPDITQNRLHELETMLQTKQVFLPLFVACVEALPEDKIRLYQCTVTSKKTFSCAGKAADTPLVTEYVSALHAIGLACTDVSITTEKDPELPIAFRIEAKHCYKG